ncbi:MAG: serine/threonine-protein kinase [Polyangiales bacterium]
MEGARFKNYVLRERLDQGGMAEIYRASRVGSFDFSREVCIKRMLPRLSSETEFVSMFIDEARISSHLRHGNIVSVEDFGNEDGQLFICMEWVNGADLKRVIKRLSADGRRMPVDAALFVVGEVLKALEYAHGKVVDGVPQNIVHRDVTPHNVMVSYFGEVKLADFGIAKATSRLYETRGDLVKGKLSYMAPEQATGKPLDRRTDLFALGVCAYEALTGSQPFQGQGRDVLYAILADRRPTLRALRPDAPPEVEAFVDRLLKKSPDERYPHAGAAHDALESLPVKVSSRSLERLMAELWPDQASIVTPAVRDAPLAITARPPRPAPEAPAVEAPDTERPEAPDTERPPGQTPDVDVVSDTDRDPAVSGFERTERASMDLLLGDHPAPARPDGEPPPRFAPGGTEVIPAVDATLTELSSAAEPAPPTAPPAPAIEPTPTPTPATTVVAPAPRRSFLALALALVALCCALAAVGVTLSRSQPPAPASPSSPRPLTAPAPAPAPTPPPAPALTVDPTPVVEQSVVVDAGAPSTAVEAPAVITFQVRPWGEVRVDGRPVRVGAPITLPAGAHALTVSQSGVVRRTEQRRFRAGERRRVVLDATER